MTMKSTIMSIITATTRSAAAAMTMKSTTMSIITATTRNAAAAMTMRSTIMNIIITMMRTVYAAVVITMMRTRHHHHHHADEVFTSWGRETPRKYTKDELEQILKTLSDSEEYGIVLRAKGMLPDTEGTWLHFDLVPGEYEIRNGSADYTGRLCVIGSKLDEAKLEKLFLL